MVPILLHNSVVVWNYWRNVLGSHHRSSGQIRNHQYIKECVGNRSFLHQVLTGIFFFFFCSPSFLSFLLRLQPHVRLPWPSLKAQTSARPGRSHRPQRRPSAAASLRGWVFPRFFSSAYFPTIGSWLAHVADKQQDRVLRRLETCANWVSGKLNSITSVTQSLGAPQGVRAPAPSNTSLSLLPDTPGLWKPTRF